VDWPKQIVFESHGARDPHMGHMGYTGCA